MQQGVSFLVTKWVCTGSAAPWNAGRRALKPASHKGTRAGAAAFLAINKYDSGESESRAAAGRPVGPQKKEAPQNSRIGLKSGQRLSSLNS